jgi:hypothetical protein
VDGKENSIQSKIILWLILKKIKGYNYINLSECANYFNIDINNKNDIKIIDTGINVFNKKFRENIIDYYEENN